MSRGKNSLSRTRRANSFLTVNHEALIVSELERIMNLHFGHIKKMANLDITSAEDAIKLSHYLVQNPLTDKDQEVFTSTLQNIMLEYPAAYSKYPIVYPLIRAKQLQDNVLWAAWDQKQWFDWFTYGDSGLIQRCLHQQELDKAPTQYNQSQVSYYRGFAPEEFKVHPDFKISKELLFNFAKRTTSLDNIVAHLNIWRFITREESFDLLYNYQTNGYAITGISSNFNNNLTKEPTKADWKKLNKLLLTHPNTQAKAFDAPLQYYKRHPNIYQIHEDLIAIKKKCPDVSINLWLEALIVQSFGEYKINRSGEKQSNFTDKRGYKNKEFFDVLALVKPNELKENEVDSLIKLAVNGNLPHFKPADISMAGRRRLAIWLLQLPKHKKATKRALEDI